MSHGPFQFQEAISAYSYANSGVSQALPGLLPDRRDLKAVALSLDWNIWWYQRFLQSDGQYTASLTVHMFLTSAEENRSKPDIAATAVDMHFRSECKHHFSQVKLPVPPKRIIWYDEGGRKWHSHKIPPPVAIIGSSSITKANIENTYQQSIYMLSLACRIAIVKNISPYLK